MMLDLDALSSWLVVGAIGLTALSGIVALLRVSGERLATTLLVAGCAASIAGSILALLGYQHVLDAPWNVPGGALRIGVDAISAMFVLPISLVCALGAIYGVGYWHDHAASGRKLRAFYGILTAGLILLVCARNVMLFFLGWEMMALAAFLLITTEDEHPTVREVGYVYILSTRLGTLCLFGTFALLAVASDSMNFDDWNDAMAGPFRDAIFVLCVIGFGLKAGLMPLHVWLPGAHANAPTHVSAQMSGVLIKVGIYGIVRITAMCAEPPLWWGVSLLIAGIASAVLGVAFAIGQHDIKRLLAYHSVENIGIITLGLGVALIGRSLERDDLIVLGFAGALLHVWNHALFKSLLFFSAGAVVHATGTREIDRLGGLWRRMPRTGLAFLTGAVAICGLPPLNGLVSELFVYLGLFRATADTPGSVWLIAMLAAAALALVGALALACFVKAFGAMFLGARRSSDGVAAVDPGLSMLSPMAILAAVCIVIGVGAPLVAPVLDDVSAAWSARELPSLGTLAPLVALSIVSGSLLLVLWICLARVKRPVPQEVGTWDCGYVAPTARMQYTSSSFAEMLVRLLGWALRPFRHAPTFAEPFPQKAAFASHVPDTVLDRGVRPLFGLIGRTVMRLRPFQGGSLHRYLLYIVIILLVLLLWS